MRLEGIHHVTCITGNAPVNVEFYAGVLGLRLVKKTVNQDDPTVYHLFYADEAGSAGADITFFEYPGRPPGPRGRRAWCTPSPSGSASEEALGFWEQRLVAAGARSRRASRRRAPLRGPGGAGPRARVVADVGDRRWSPRTRRSRPSSRSRASTAFAPSRATPHGAASCSRTCSGSSRRASGVGGSRRGARRALRVRPAARLGPGVPGAGTVHHVAWASTMDDHEAWQRRVTEAGGRRRR